MTDDEHINFSEFLHSIHGKPSDVVVVLVGYYSTVKNYISNGLQLIGCASHHSQLAVSNILADYHDIILLVHGHMAKFRPPYLMVSYVD